MPPRIVIIGGGFGGLYTARGLRHAEADITLVDRHNYHLFQPLLYQVATAALNPSDIAAPIRSIVRHQVNISVVLGDAIGIDVDAKRVQLADGMLDYDFLVVAAGATHSYFAHPEWERDAPGLKTIDDALEIRRVPTAAAREIPRRSVRSRRTRARRARSHDSGTQRSVRNWRPRRGKATRRHVRSRRRARRNSGRTTHRVQPRPRARGTAAAR